MWVLYMCVLLHVEARGWHEIFSSSLLTLFLRQVSYLTRLVNQQVPGILLSPLPSAKITGMLCQFFCGCWKSKLRSSCLHSNTLLSGPSLKSQKWIFNCLSRWVKHKCSIFILFTEVKLVSLYQTTKERNKGTMYGKVGCKKVNMTLLWVVHCFVFRKSLVEEFIERRGKG